MTKITVTGKQTDSTGQFCENRIVEKTMAVMAFSTERTGEMIMTAIFMSFGIKRKSSERKETEMSGEYGRKYWQIVRLQTEQRKK